MPNKPASPGPGNRFRKCNMCNGTGAVLRPNHEHKFVRTVCPACQGAGQIWLGNV